MIGLAIPAHCQAITRIVGVLQHLVPGFRRMHFCKRQKKTFRTRDCSAQLYSLENSGREAPKLLINFGAELALTSASISSIVPLRSCLPSSGASLAWHLADHNAPHEDATTTKKVTCHRSARGEIIKSFRNERQRGRREITAGLLARLIVKSFCGSI